MVPTKNRIKVCWRYWNEICKFLSQEDKFIVGVYVNKIDLYIYDIDGKNACGDLLGVLFYGKYGVNLAIENDILIKDNFGNIAVKRGNYADY